MNHVEMNPIPDHSMDYTDSEHLLYALNERHGYVGNQSQRKFVQSDSFAAGVNKIFPGISKYDWHNLVTLFPATHQWANLDHLIQITSSKTGMGRIVETATLAPMTIETIGKAHDELTTVPNGKDIRFVSSESYLSRYEIAVTRIHYASRFRKDDYPLLGTIVTVATPYVKPAGKNVMHTLAVFTRVTTALVWSEEAREALTFFGNAIRQSKETAIILERLQRMMPFGHFGGGSRG